MRTMTSEMQAIIGSLRDYMACYDGIFLRPYQVEAAHAVLESVLNSEGESFVWIFARQGGKDETLAALYQYLMVLFSFKDTSIVAASPTFRPQSKQAMHRLEDRLSRHLVLRRSWKRDHNTFRIGSARAHFYSAQSNANVVGATAGLLLVVNEAQDISPAIYDRRFAPMAAANNATRLFSGTAWTRDTLLAQQVRMCRIKEEQDGRKRVFLVDGPEIAKVHPPYGKFLEGEITRLGQDHPIVVSQYLCREIDAHAGMFTETRMALMFGRADNLSGSPLQMYPFAQHPERSERVGEGSASRGGFTPPSAASAPRGADGRGCIYSFLLDVAGQDECPRSGYESRTSIADSLDRMLNPGRDSTTLSIVEVDLSSLETLQAPTYRVVMRYSWTGENHLAIFGKLKALVESWNPQRIVIDATGVGEGLWAMLDKAFHTRVLPVKFTQQAKSDIGWTFLSIIETGRFQDHFSRSPLHRYPDGDRAASRSAAEGGLGVGWEGVGLGLGAGVGVNPNDVRLQYASCRSEILPGPAKTLRWGVPDGTRGPDGQLIHDDFILADSLVAVLDKLQWTSHSPTLIVPARDPLEDMDHNF